MDFHLQFVLLYLYDALTLEYRLLAGNIREVSAMKNTVVMSVLEECTFVGDKGFFSQSNIEQLENMSMQYIIPLLKREESLNGWLFINHISMLMIYKLFQILKITPLNKKQKLIHRYSINDAIEHLKTIKKIKFACNEFVASEINKSTKKTT